MSLKDKLAKARTSPKPGAKARKSDGEKTIEVDSIATSDATEEVTQEVVPGKSRFGSLAVRPKAYITEENELVSDEKQTDSSVSDSKPSPLSAYVAPAIVEPKEENSHPFESTVALEVHIELITQDIAFSDSAPAALIESVPRDPFAWYLNEGDIPQGSAFSLQQWTAAVRKAGSENVVYELHDKTGRKLTTMPATRSNGGESDDIEGKIFGFSLVTSSEVHAEISKSGAVSPPVHTTYIHKEWQYKECPVAVYMVTRSQNAIAKGSNWAIWRSWPKDGDTTEHQRDLAVKKNNKQSTYGSQQYKPANPGPTTSSRFSAFGKPSQPGNRPRG